MKWVSFVLIFVLFAEFFFLGYHYGKAQTPPTIGKSRKGKKLLLISIDGFRFEYLTRGQTPNLAKLGTKK